MDGVGVPVEGLNARLIALHGESVAGRMKELLARQKESWEGLRKGYAALAEVRVRELSYPGVTVRLEFNPARIVSTSAPVDDRSIRERKCFLCAANLPPEQRGFLYGADHLVLCNPFPIFREHFTIPHKDHVPQRIDGRFGTLLALARDLDPHFMVMYNGPRSGASAPDHQHFQAGERGFLPIEREYAALAGGGRTLSDTGTRVLAVDDGLRRWFALEGGDVGGLEVTFGGILRALAFGTATAEEPMLNILAWYMRGAWRVIIVPRAKHRPSAYFAEGENKILISPAGTDCGGVCVTPVEKDFQNLTAESMRAIFDEVMAPPDAFTLACDRAEQALHAQ
jgi:hypothetical protein